MSAVGRFPRIRVRSEDAEEREPSPVVTYYMILAPTLLLGLFGMLMVFSSSTITSIAAGQSPYEAFLKPLGIMVFALVVAGLFSRLPARVWERLAPWLLLAGYAAQSLVLTPLGQQVGGNRNWILVPGLGQTVQPSEFLKLATCLFLGRALGRAGARVGDPRQTFVTVGLPVLGAIGSVMLGHDLGTVLVFVALALGALWVAGAPAAWFVLLAAAGAGVGGFLVAANPTRLRRVLAVLPGHSQAPSTSAPTQSDHALWALGSGGLTGLGPGASREKWNYLQEAHTDFIFAIIGEEFGLLGTLAVLACFALLLYGLLRLCRRARSPFVRISTAAVACWIGVQAFINIGSVIGVLPVVGVPLPLLSSGGSSYLFTAMALGIALGFAREDAGLSLFTRPDEASAGRDPRRTPRRRRVERGRAASRS